MEFGPRDLAENKCVLSLRTGGKVEASLDNLSETISDNLEMISDQLLERSSTHMSNLVKKFPGFESTNDGLKLCSSLEDGIVYELAFDGNDADAELLEKSTGLTLLGDSIDPYSEPENCVITGKLTTRKQHIARMY